MVQPKTKGNRGQVNQYCTNCAYTLMGPSYKPEIDVRKIFSLIRLGESTLLEYACSGCRLGAIQRTLDDIPWAYYVKVGDNLAKRISHLMGSIPKKYNYVDKEPSEEEILAAIKKKEVIVSVMELCELYPETKSRVLTFPDIPSERPVYYFHIDAYPQYTNNEEFRCIMKVIRIQKGEAPVMTTLKIKYNENIKPVKLVELDEVIRESLGAINIADDYTALQKEEIHKAYYDLLGYHGANY